ncbi:MAG TPA: VOC family protein [Asticcacaulis sp.]|nr:VOC family protein [Asticcacaulis sp.]
MDSHFIWYELITSDLDAAISFYSDVVGWTVAPSQTPGMDYRLIHAADEGVGGMMKAPDAGMPSAWFGYINVADVDAEVAAFEAGGGKVLWPANEDAGVGRMAMVADPQGAAIYVMAPTGEGESQAFKPDAPGHCGWNEYHATDWEKAFDFYAGRFGWVKDVAMDMGPAGTYQVFTSGGVQTGAMMNNPLPQQAWLFYFNVNDIDAAVERLTAQGGTIEVPQMEVPGGKWVIVARDPQGAMFGLLGSRPTA